MRVATKAIHEFGVSSHVINIINLLVLCDQFATLGNILSELLNAANQFVRSAVNGAGNILCHLHIVISKNTTKRHTLCDLKILNAAIDFARLLLQVLHR